MPVAILTESTKPIQTESTTDGINDTHTDRINDTSHSPSLTWMHSPAACPACPAATHCGHRLASRAGHQKLHLLFSGLAVWVAQGWKKAVAASACTKSRGEAGSAAAPSAGSRLLR